MRQLMSVSRNDSSVFRPFPPISPASSKNNFSPSSRAVSSVARRRFSFAVLPPAPLVQCAIPEGAKAKSAPTSPEFAPWEGPVYAPPLAITPSNRRGPSISLPSSPLTQPRSHAFSFDPTRVSPLRITRVIFPVSEEEKREKREEEIEKINKQLCEDERWGNELSLQSLLPRYRQIDFETPRSSVSSLSLSFSEEVLAQKIEGLFSSFADLKQMQEEDRERKDSQDLREKEGTLIRKCFEQMIVMCGICIRHEPFSELTKNTKERILAVVSALDRDFPHEEQRGLREEIKRIFRGIEKESKAIISSQNA